MPDSIVALGEGKRIVGKLRFERDGRRQHSQFEYAANWITASDRFALSPGMPLREGSHYSSGRDNKRLAEHAQRQTLKTTHICGLPNLHQSEIVNPLRELRLLRSSLRPLAD